jgi:hypothetical protein
LRHRVRELACRKKCSSDVKVVGPGYVNLNVITTINGYVRMVCSKIFVDGKT